MPAPEIVAVRIDPRTVTLTVRGMAPGTVLREAEPYEPDAARPVDLAGARGAVLRLPRVVDGRDRLYSRFTLVAPDGRRSATRWVTDLERPGATDAPLPWPRSQKGITCPVDLDDVVALGTKYVNTNVTLRDVLDLGNPNPAAWHTVDGERFPVNVRYLEGLDRTVRRLTDAGINVTVVLNNPVPTTPDPSNPFVHPATDLAGAPNHLGAFRLVDRIGYRAYRAVLEIFAERYSRPDRRHGWITGYIVGNEIQQHWEWYNRGRVEPEAFLAEYATALRVTWLALRKAHSGLRAYVSMDHHWTGSMKGDPTREIRGDQVLTTLNRLSKAGGDFDWHVAFHPYPENLFEPRFWRDRNAPVAFDTPKITFKNLEVLPAFLERPEMRCRGKARRIILSEQGFHAAPTPEGERVQAAALAAATYRVGRMPGIDAFMLHRHVSHRGEGGLRLGLWAWDPDSPDPSAPGRRLPSWETFRDADTPGWRAAFAFALPIVGIRDWSELDPVRRVPEHAPRSKPRPGVVADLAALLGTARRVNTADWRAVDAQVDGRDVPGIFHHPNAEGDADATFALDLPAARELTLSVHTGFAADSANGARFAVLVDGVVLWSAEQTGRAFVARRVDLTPFAGKRIGLTLRVHGLGNIANDWCVWAEPLVRRGGRPVSAPGSGSG